MGLAERQRLRPFSKRLTRNQKITIVTTVLLFFLYITSPYDSRVRSFARFSHNSLQDYWQNHHPSDAWLFRKQRYPIDPDKDVGVILKTGYGTRHRIPVALEALGNETFFADTVIVQDFPVLDDQRNYRAIDGKEVPTVDIIGWGLENGVMRTSLHRERVLKYKSMTEAIEAEEWMLSDILGKDMGWELDAMKFLPSLEYVWRAMPKKKWYIMLDDDTYMIKSSMSLLMGHLNYRKPQFIGNPVGDYKGRFPHGGSSVILSGAALAQLFDGRPDVVDEGNHEAPSVIWGDKVLATTLMKVAVYLDESYRRMFNGESPWMTRMWADRLCLPLLSFHGLGDPEAMQAVGETFKDMKEPVYWGALGNIYGSPAFASFVEEPIRQNMDYVGRLDEWSTTVENIVDVGECLKICQRQSTNCMAWTYDPGSRQCHYAPWSTIGDFAEGRFSGVNGKLGQKLTSRCHSH
ncbi:family 31 glycosyltransferase [Xylariaceae sp. FL0804]|nr:family 31 glycosyltransferase [Xylariaceae sp. FL0804]